MKRFPAEFLVLFCIGCATTQPRAGFVDKPQGIKGSHEGNPMARFTVVFDRGDLRMTDGKYELPRHPDAFLCHLDKHQHMICQEQERVRRQLERDLDRVEQLERDLGIVPDSPSEFTTDL